MYQASSRNIRDVDRSVRANLRIGNLAVAGSGDKLDPFGSGCAGGAQQREEGENRKNLDKDS